MGNKNPRELPADPQVNRTIAAISPLEREKGRYAFAASHQHPATWLQALMETPPGGTQATSREELYPVREALADALDLLTERERYIFDAHEIERISYRAIADRLSMGKSQVCDICNDARAKLAAALQDNPVIRRCLEAQ